MDWRPKMYLRNYLEALIDRMLLLYLCEVSDQCGYWIGITKLQKLTFLSEKFMLDKQQKGFNYPFFRWENGPMSKEIYQDKELLMKSGLLNSKHYPSKRGQILLKDFFASHFDTNKEFFSKIKEVVAKNGKFNTQKLVDIVYDLQIRPIGWKHSAPIREIPKGTDLFLIIDENEAKNAFQIIDQTWIETLALEFELTQDEIERMKQPAPPEFQETHREGIELAT